MTTKDFELIARIIQETPGVSHETRESLAGWFAKHLHQTNPRFKKELFIEACTR